MRYNTCRRRITANGLSCEERNPSGCFFFFFLKKKKKVDLLQPLEFVPTSRERVIPMGWQVRSVLGDCISKAKVISIQAPQYRQFALISDFLDLANLSIRKKKTTLATNWIKDRHEGLKLQN